MCVEMPHGEPPGQREPSVISSPGHNLQTDMPSLLAAPRGHEVLRAVAAGLKPRRRPTAFPLSRLLTQETEPHFKITTLPSPLFNFTRTANKLHLGDKEKAINRNLNVLSKAPF